MKHSEMKRIKSVDIEFKELDRMTGKRPESVSKEVCAFADTEGGELYIGVRNDGSIVGGTNVDDVMAKVSDTRHDTILPDMQPLSLLILENIADGPVCYMMSKKCRECTEKTRHKQKLMAGFFALSGALNMKTIIGSAAVQTVGFAADHADPVGTGAFAA